MTFTSEHSPCIAVPFYMRLVLYTAVVKYVNPQTSLVSPGTGAHGRYRFFKDDDFYILDFRKTPPSGEHFRIDRVYICYLTSTTQQWYSYFADEENKVQKPL